MKFMSMTLLICTLLLNQRIQGQIITKQFEQTRYDINELCMVDSSIGWAVGRAHWDNIQKRYRSTLLKTVDSGVNWEAIDTNFTETLWDIHFVNADSGWAVGNFGLILHTNDGGINWLRQNANTDLDIKSVHFVNAHNGWMVANEVIHTNPFNEIDGWHGRIYYTNDAGESWIEQDLPPTAGLIHSIFFMDHLNGWAVGVKNDEISYFVENSCTAYLTNDGGQTWVEKFNSDLDLAFTDVFFIDSQHGWIVGFAGNSSETGGSIFRTVNGGETWQRIAENHTLWDVEFLDTLRGYTVGSAYGSAWGPPVLRTMDGGVTWETIRMSTHNNNGLYGLALFSEKVIAMGDGGYLVTSTDIWGELGVFSGEHLFNQHLINDLYDFEDVFFINQMQGWVVGKKSLGPETWSQIILHTADGGESWTEQYSFTETSYNSYLRLDAVQFINNQVGWAVGTSVKSGDSTTSGILFTDDGGLNWSQQGPDVSVGEIVDVCFFDEQKGWALTNATTSPDGFIQLLKTNNGGATWELINTGQKGTITIGYAIRSGKVFFQDENKGWVLGAQSDLIRTLDGGNIWSSVVLPYQYYNTFSMAFSDEENGIICGETNYITEDGGENWAENNLSPKTLTDITFIGSELGWMVGEGGEIYKTVDGGTTWNHIDNPVTSVGLKAVSFCNEKYGWAAGKLGTVIKIDNSNPDGLETIKQAQIPFELYQNYPNPFNTKTVIKYSLLVDGHTELSIYNLLGHKVATIVSGRQPAGNYTVEWDASRFSSGIYLYRLSTDQGLTRAKKLLFIK